MRVKCRKSSMSGDRAEKDQDVVDLTTGPENLPTTCNQVIDLTKTSGPVRRLRVGQRVRSRKAACFSRAPRYAAVVENESPICERSEQRENFVRCPVCLESLHGQPTYSTICGHIYCEGCISGLIGDTKICAVCRQSIARKNSVHRIYFS